MLCIRVQDFHRPCDGTNLHFSVRNLSSDKAGPKAVIDEIIAFIMEDPIAQLKQPSLVCSSSAQTPSKAGLSGSVVERFQQPNVGNSAVRAAASKHACGIVYCMTKKACEMLASALRKGGVSAYHYHAGQSPAERRVDNAVGQPVHFRSLLLPLRSEGSFNLFFHAVALLHFAVFFAFRYVWNRQA